MAAADIGRTTRRLILKTCRELFYVKGYVKTTYSDLTELSGVNRGSIYYHFKGKANLAASIQVEIYEERIGKVRALLPGRRDELIEFVSSFVMWECVLQDERFRVFLSESVLEAGSVQSMENTEAYIAHHGMGGGTAELDPLNMSVSLGIHHAALKYVREHPGQYSAKTMAYYIFRSHERLFGARHDEALLAEAESVFDRMLVRTGENFSVELFLKE